MYSVARVPSITTKIVEIAVLGFNHWHASRRLPPRRLDGGNKLRAHSGRASLTLSFTSDDDEDDDKLTEASLCQHSTAPPPDLLLVNARRLMATLFSVSPSSICPRAPFLSFPFGPDQRSTVSRIRLLLC